MASYPYYRTTSASYFIPLYQSLTEMANRLIRIEDMATIATSSQLTHLDPEDALSERSDILTNETYEHDREGNVKERGDDESNETYDTSGHALPPAPGSGLSPRSAAMVLEIAGPGDGKILLDNAKDLAATIRLLKDCFDITHERAQNAEAQAQDCENRANEAEDRLEELERNKENEPPRGRRRGRSSSGSTDSTPPEYTAACPQGFEENTRQARGFYIPDDDGVKIEPKYIRFIQGPNPHAEGTQGSGFPVYLYQLTSVADYDDTHLPHTPMPIWSTPALPRHNNMYNTVLRAALEHNDWGVCADIIRHRLCEDQINIWEARAEEAVQRVERAREERSQTRYRLEAARAHRHFAHLERTNREDDWRWDDQPDMVIPIPQLGRRGRRNVRGRGRPRS